MAPQPLQQEIIPNQTAASEDGVWFVYDGGCPLCTRAAMALQIRQAAGSLHLLDGRSDPDHPLLKEIRKANLDLDEGMILKYGGRLYHGADALQMMALLGSAHGWFNRLNAWLFKSATVSRISYPILRAGRNTLLMLRGVPKINLDEKPN
ncbi:DCC1-like thiol-disulfide oxidoreductase family protein [Sneathiella limimaris]|uniref:DCC1-like thiol-disulfide oxidoreductase family protein n=1 Tax=Sneathiella limimaris TaxID=1964213 RepID=UPI0019D2A711